VRFFRVSVADAFSTDENSPMRLSSTNTARYQSEVDKRIGDLSTVDPL
jgi:hypothetical protein